MKMYETEMQGLVEFMQRREQYAGMNVVSKIVPEDLLIRIRQNDPTLCTLHLDMYDLDDEEIRKVCAAMQTNTHIKKIVINAAKQNIAYGRLTARSAELLSALKIDTLWMAHQPIGDEGARFLASASFIKDMFILDCNITLEGANHFFLNESLHEIDLNIDDWQGQKSVFYERMDVVLGRNISRVDPGSLSEFNQNRHTQKLEEVVVKMIENDNPEGLSRLILQLDNGVNSIVQNSSLLMWCVHTNALGCLEYLLKAGVLLEQHDREYTALFQAAEEGKVDVVCLLLPYCASLTGEFYFNCEKPISAVASKLLHELYGFFNENTGRQSRLDNSFIGLLNKFLKRWSQCLSQHTLRSHVFWGQVSEEQDLLYQFPMYAVTLLNAFKSISQEEALAAERLKNYAIIYQLLRKKEGIVTGKHDTTYPNYYSDLGCTIRDHQVETPVRYFPPSRLTKEDLEEYIHNLNENLFDTEESGITWEAYPNLYIAEFRGVHYSPEYFTEEQILDDLQTCHLNRFAPAPAVMMMSALFPRQLQVSRESMILDNNYRIRDAMDGFRQSGPVKLYGRDYANAQFALQERTTNQYNGYNSDVANGANEYCVVLRDLKAKGYITYAMSDFPRHAIRYACNLKNYQNNIYTKGGGNKALTHSGARYDSNGKPARRFLGKVYISLFTPLQMAQHRMIHVAGAHNRRRVNIDDTKVPERETGSPGGVNQSCLFYEAIMELPDFTQPWTQEFIEKFNINEAMYLEYKKRFARGLNVDNIVKDLMDHILNHRTKQLFDLAVKEARRRGGYLIFKHYLGQYGLLPEGIRKGNEIPNNPYNYELDIIRPSFAKQFSSGKTNVKRTHDMRLFGPVKREREGDSLPDLQAVKKEKLSSSRLALTIADPGYWYSVHDGICLLRNLRSQFVLLEEVQQDRNHPYRQNTQNIFLADPYHHSNFENYLNNDIARLTASQEFAHIPPWAQMPTVIIIPVLSGVHWISVKIELDYNNMSVIISWKDPFGDKANIDDYKHKYSATIKNSCLQLMQFHHSRIGLHLNNILFKEQIDIPDQQGYLINGSDCGVIVFSNISDLLANRDFRMTSYDSEDYDDIIRQQRETDFQVVGEDAFDDDGISDMRTKQLEGDQAKCRKERLNQTFSSVTDQHIMDEVQSMSPESIDIFFGYLDIYKLLEIAYSEFLSDMTSEYERKTELCLN